MNSQRGFTLIELAIVLVIVTILIGGLAVPLSAQIQARRIAETNKTLEEAREALIGYAMTHKVDGIRPYLPCPDTNGDGIEELRTSNVCPSRIGYLPWVTLGTGAQDAWGNRLRYSTHTNFTNDNTGIYNALPPLNSWNQICSSPACGTYIAEDVPAVVVSLGPNGWGALNVNGNTLAAPTSDDEKENKDDDVYFVSRSPTTGGSEFDDQVTWISFSVLLPRVCPTGCAAP